MDEIEHFYSNYKGFEIKGDRGLMQVHRTPTPEQMRASRRTYRCSPANPGIKSKNDSTISFNFDGRNYVSLRLVIDEVNGWDAASPRRRHFGARRCSAFWRLRRTLDEVALELFGAFGVVVAQLRAHHVKDGVRDAVFKRGDLVGEVVEGLHNVSTSTSSSPSAYWARSTFLSNFPTLVLGTLSTNVQRSGSHHLATRSERNSRSSSALAVDSGFSTTQHSGRSCHLSSGTAITAASKTAG